MNTTPSKELGILAVASMFGFIGLLVSFVALGFGAIASIFLGVLVGAIAAVVLWLGWREPAPGPAGPRDLSPKADTAAAAPAPKAAVEAAPKAEAKSALAAKKAVTEPKAAPKAAATGEPATLSMARKGGADDLKRLNGVGPALEDTLNDLGFYHFDQVASWTEDDIAWVDSRLRFKGRIERDGWVAQAKELAKDAKG